VRRILFGGSFDPVHAAHLAVAEAAARLLGADRVSFLPAASPPHKPGGTVASAGDRLEMLRRAVAGNPLFDVLDAEIVRGGTSYTCDTVEALLAGPCRGDSLVLLLGQDQLADLASWRRARELAALVPIAVAPRPGAPEPPWERLAAALGDDAVRGIRGRVLPLPASPISSTEVRRRVAAGKSIRCWVPDPVADWIEERGLYRPGGAAEPS
jgi:nicotinate-nucleotide adenylyltransferase